MIIIFLDTETTGLDFNRHRVIDIALQVMDAETNTVIATYESIVQQPDFVLENADPRSLVINGFNKQMAKQGKVEHEVAQEIIALFDGINLGQKEAVFLCQNPSFDRPFFQQLIPVEAQQKLQWPYHWLDLASMYWVLCPAKISKEKDISKNAIAASLSLPKEVEPHRAMNGVCHLMQCYQMLLQFQKQVA